MTTRLTGHDLTQDDVVLIARGDEAVDLDPRAIERMHETRGIVEKALARGDAIYGLSTGVGVLKRTELEDPASGSFSERLIRHHLVALGPPAPTDVVRASMLVLANGFAGATTGVRPELAQRVVSALNGHEEPNVRTLGSIGQADLAPMADLAVALFDGFPLAPGEGLALISNNAFSTAWGALAVADAATLLDSMEVAGALSLEGMAVNHTMLDRAIGDVRPYLGLQRSLAHLRDLLEGSFIWRSDAARNLQDPLTSRNLPQIQGACRDALDHVERQLAIELNASQGNPIVVHEGERIVSVANFEILPLAAALDYLRLVLATAFTTAAERVVKLLETPWTGLPTGLLPRAGTAEPGLSYLGIACQALAAEARLLAAPVSFEMASSAHAEGIEDRATNAPLAARRLSDMVDMGNHIVARELVVAAQAVEVRGLTPLGHGTGRASEAVRRHVPFLDVGGFVPADLEPLVQLVGTGALS
jgi:histidine ammonia-lyase